MTIKLVNLNMWHGGKLFKNIKAFIKDEQPHIVALQEVYQSEEFRHRETWHVVGELAHALEFPHFAFAPAYGHEFEGVRVQSGNAVLSQYPIESSQTHFYDVPYDGIFAVIPDSYETTPRNLQHCVVDLQGTLLHVFNTQGIWGLEGGDTERRRKMCQLIADKVKDAAPALLTGDFNLREKTKSVALIEQHMQNVFKGELTTSFNMDHKTNPGYASAVVDMMFASRDIRAVSHHVSSNDVSDHLGLVGVFDIPAG